MLEITNDLLNMQDSPMDFNVIKDEDLTYDFRVHSLLILTALQG